MNQSINQSTHIYIEPHVTIMAKKHYLSTEHLWQKVV